MELPAAALGWLRHVHDASPPDDPDERALLASALGLVGARVPAWLEPVAGALDRLGDGHDARWVRRAVTGTAGAGPATPTVPPAATTSAAGRAATAVIESLGGADGLHRLATLGVTPVPQVVGVPLAQAGLRRAEWVDGNLYLHLVPVRADPARRVALRLVGAEPRQWDIAGIAGVLADLSSQGLQLLVPMVDGPLELSRGSY
jgi:hypothetical protein